MHGLDGDPLEALGQHDTSSVQGGRELFTVRLQLRGGGVKKKPGKGMPELDEKQKRLLEIEEAKKAARQAKLELRHKLEVEKRNSNMNRLKIQNQWRKIMRLAKVGPPKHVEPFVLGSIVIVTFALTCAFVNRLKHCGRTSRSCHRIMSETWTVRML